MSNSQPQETIPLQLKSGKESAATLNGNNAAWLCVCGYRLPLIWSSINSKIPTICDECGKEYIGLGENEERIEQGRKPFSTMEETTS
ncbi:MAG: hypothetical protein R1F54_04685 [Candidatus Zeuxoniibacter abyssi]|nr:MAG: hypothetical protein R1F54_04685 [Candidatus Persebacteraceae bacterium AB1(2)]